MNIVELSIAQEDYLSIAEECGLSHDGFDCDGQPVFIGSHKAFDDWEEQRTYLNNPFDGEPNELEDTD